MLKKVVFLPYDFDTALGINNEGALVFNYDLEDIDQLQGGADIFNGQQSVLWKNIRAAFFDEIKTMYQTLRSQSTDTTGLSYKAVEKMFEDHQGKWSEAIFNEDAWFKYIDPLIAPSAGKEATAAYLSMLQGSKAEQRKWWLYNRFRYIDSKYNAGDALTDYIQVRGYAKANITITPYATIYPTVKFGSYLVQERGTRGVATTLVCPLDNVNDTEIYIYSASQLASVGDLSGLKVGFADFSMATKLQSIKLGDSDAEYSNPNLNELYLGNNVLLTTLDVRNCTALGSGDQKTVNISGCSNIEYVYFDNTQVTGVTLPNGGVLKTLHLPSTITNLTIMNQPNITDLTVNVTNVSTLRIENCPTINTKTMLNTIPTNSRVRLVGFAWEATNATEIESLLDTLDTMRGLDINGNNLDDAYVEGTIHTTSLTGAQIASYNARYPYVTVTADYTESTLTFKSYDNETTYQTITCLNGVPQSSIPSAPAKPDSSDGHYSYTPVGWNTTPNATTNDDSAVANVTANRTVYPAYTSTVKTYTVTWKNYGGTTLETDTNVPWGTVPTYDGATPTYNGQTSSGWTPSVAAITGDTVYTATYVPQYTATFVRASADGGGTLYTGTFSEGTTPVYGGSTPTTTQGDSTDFTFTGWTPSLAPIYANTTYTAVFQDNRAATIQYLTRNITTYTSPSNTTFAGYGLGYATQLTSATAPATSVQAYAFASDTLLETVDLSAASGSVTIATNAFNGCTKLTHLIIRSSTMATLSNTSAFTGTQIAVGNGAIYVPTALVATYKANANWSNYFIADINDYPLSDFSTITDSWAEIIANANYATDYSIGDTKLIDLGTQGTHYAELVALDTDDKADESGKARMTWILKTLLPTTHNMNSTSTTTGGYSASAMRTYLNDTIKPLIPDVVRNAIVPVTKISSTYENSAVVVNGQTSTEEVWIPSNYEIFGTTTYENTGAVYTTKFNSANARIKYLNGSAYNWWTRSAYSTTVFRFVYYDGNDGRNGADVTFGVALGFCI